MSKFEELKATLIKNSHRLLSAAYEKCDYDSLVYDAIYNAVKRLNELESEGLIESRGTLGRFVTEDPEKIAVARNLEAKRLACDFVSGALDLSLSEEETLQLIKEAFDERS